MKDERKGISSSRWSWGPKMDIVTAGNMRLHKCYGYDHERQTVAIQRMKKLNLY